MKKRFLICPSHVKSKNDGQTHYISAEMLMRLYRVAPGECCAIDCFPEPNPSGLIVLAPRYDGDYEEYLAKQLEKAKE